MKRLHQLCRREVDEWQKERQRIGTIRYGDSDLHRYGLVDVTEELLDALNIIDRMINRMNVQKIEMIETRTMLLEHIKTELWTVIEEVAIKDKCFPDKVCTDEQGGERIWWKNDT